MDIRAVEETTTVYMLGARPLYVAAVKLTLAGGEVRTIPVDFPHREEIVARLRAMVSSGKDG